MRLPEASEYGPGSPPQQMEWTFEPVRVAVFLTWIWIDSRSMEADMHPVNYLFEEIYRDYWGIPSSKKDRLSGKRAEIPLQHHRSIFFRANRRG